MNPEKIDTFKRQNLHLSKPIQNSCYDLPTHTQVNSATRYQDRSMKINNLYSSIINQN